MTPVDNSAASPMTTASPRARALLDTRYSGEHPRQRLLHWLAACWPSARDAREPLSATSGQWLQQLIVATRAQLVVTLGTADGIAAVWLADALRSIPGGRSDRALIGFEHNPASAQRARDVLRRAGVSRYVDIIKPPAADRRRSPMVGEALMRRVTLVSLTRRACSLGTRGRRVFRFALTPGALTASCSAMFAKPLLVRGIS